MRILFLSTLKGLWSVSVAGLDTSKKRSRHRFSKALAFNAVPPRSNNNNTYSVTIISVYHLKFKCVLLCLAESVPSFVCMLWKGRGVLTEEQILQMLSYLIDIFTLWLGYTCLTPTQPGGSDSNRSPCWSLGGGFGMLCWVVGTTHLAEVVAHSQRAPSVLAEMVCFCFGMCCSDGSEVWSKSLLAIERQHFLF